MLDKEVQELIQEELTRQENTIELIASENIVSQDILDACGSIFTNKYAEGRPYKRYYNGCEVVDKLEALAVTRCKELFNVEHANVQPHSGAQANMAVFLACLNPGDTILSMDLSNGGHLSHGSPVNFSGKYYNIVSYGVDSNGYIDYDAIQKQALECKPKLIICGASNYSKVINFKKFKEIADSVNALLLADIAHIAGLVATDCHPSPAGLADFITTTTHKSLRGPRGGVVMCTAEWADRIDKAIFPGMQGGPLEHVIAAKAVCFGEALKPEFKEYCEQVVLNSQVLSMNLIKQGLDIVGGLSENHLMTLDLKRMELTGKDITNLLETIGITANKNTVPNDPQSPFVTSGIRLGVCAVTTRGFKEDDMVLIASLIAAAIKFRNEEPALKILKQTALELCQKFPLKYRNVKKITFVNV